MFALLIPILASLPGLIGKFFSDQNELLKAQAAADLAVEQAKLQLAGQIAEQQMEVSKTVLGATSPTFKYFTFFMWFGPYMLQILWPSKGQLIFQNMMGMPEWYAQSCVIIMFSVWGIAVASPVIGNVFDRLDTFFSDKRSDKIALAQVNKQAVYDAIRHIKGNVSQADVKLWDPVIDEVNKGL